MCHERRPVSIGGRTLEETMPVLPSGVSISALSSWQYNPEEETYDGGTRQHGFVSEQVDYVDLKVVILEREYDERLPSSSSS